MLPRRTGRNRRVRAHWPRPARSSAGEPVPSLSDEDPRRSVVALTRRQPISHQWPWQRRKDEADLIDDRQLGVPAAPRTIRQFSACAPHRRHIRQCLATRRQRRLPANRTPARHPSRRRTRATTCLSSLAIDLRGGSGCRSPIVRWVWRRAGAAEGGAPVGPSALRGPSRCAERAIPRPRGAPASARQARRRRPPRCGAPLLGRRGRRSAAMR